MRSSASLLSYFFLQAEDGIRDVAVTGVQTCALPILIPAHAKDQHQVAKTEWPPKQRDNAEDTERGFVRDRRVVGVHKIRDTIAQGKNHVKSCESPKGPNRKPFPRNRAGGLRAEIFEEKNKRGEN